MTIKKADADAGPLARLLANGGRIAPRTDQAARPERTEADRAALAAAGGWGITPSSTLAPDVPDTAAAPAAASEATDLLAATKAELADLKTKRDRAHWDWRQALRRGDGRSMGEARRRAGEWDDWVLAAQVLHTRAALTVATEDHEAAEAERRAIGARTRARMAVTPPGMMRDPGAIGEERHDRNVREHAQESRAAERVAQTRHALKEAQDAYNTALDQTMDNGRQQELGRINADLARLMDSGETTHGRTSSH